MLIDQTPHVSLSTALALVRACFQNLGLSFCPPKPISEFFVMFTLLHQHLDGMQNYEEPRTLNISNMNEYTDTHCDWRGIFSASTGFRAIHRSSRYPEHCRRARRASCPCLSPFSPGSSVLFLDSTVAHVFERHPVWWNFAPGKSPASWAPQPALVRRKTSCRYCHHDEYVCC